MISIYAVCGKEIPGGATPALILTDLFGGVVSYPVSKLADFIDCIIDGLCEVVETTAATTAFGTATPT